MNKLTNSLSQLSIARISAIISAAFLCCYLTAAISLVFFDFYLHALDTVIVMLSITLAMVVAAALATIRLHSEHLSERMERREVRAWFMIAGFAAVTFIGRLMYAIDELSSGGSNRSIPIADVLFGVSFLFLASGLLLIPWADGKHTSTSLLLDAALVAVAIGTIFWPLLLGPALQGELTGAVNVDTLASYLVGTIVLAGLIFWIIIRDVRSELWPTAVAFLLSILSKILILLAYLSFMVVSHSGDFASEELLTVNAVTSLSFLLLTVAGVFRLRSVTLRQDHDHEESKLDHAPVHTWQIILPYPILATLVLMRLGMEVFDWRTDYRVGMVAGIGLIAGLMMVRQLQMLRYNQYLYRKVAGSAVRDGLTGLFNHRAMHDILHMETARAARSGDSVAVLFIDIDHFKHLNDTCGHKQGDQVLVSVADQLSSVARSSDVVGRYGGEEFMIICPNVSVLDARRLGERLRLNVSDQEFIFSGARVGVTISIGIAIFPDDSEEAERLIDCADKAMYLAKAAGRNRIRLYSGDANPDGDPPADAGSTSSLGGIAN